MEQEAPAKRDFFISYNGADRTWAEWIAWQLEAAGYTLFIQAWDFRPGSNFVLEMHRAAELAERTVPVLSPNFLAARFTQPEWAAAFKDDPTGEQGRVVPVRVAECNPKGLLGPIVYIDLIGRDEARAKDELLRGVRRERAKPDESPAFPGAAGSADRPTAAVEKPARFPGARPAIWNVPHRRNPNFTGREELLDQLRQTLAHGRAALTAMHGLGGIGKTQVALEYACRFASEYRAVWWLRSEDPSTLAADYAGFAPEARLPLAETEDQNLIIGIVRRWFEQNTGWLLIFDNAPSADATKPFLPQGDGHVIITSRDPRWREIATPLEVDKLDREESAEFLLRRGGRGTKEKGDAAALAEVLGDLPLALAQAASYIEAKQRSIADYLDLFRKQELRLLERGTPGNYPDTVGTTWVLAFEEVGATDPAAADLLKLIAFFAPDVVPLRVLEEQADRLPERLAALLSDPFRLDDGIEVLRRYSLVDVSGRALSIHRLVQAVTRHRLPEDERQVWAEAAQSVVAAAFPFVLDKPATWLASTELLPHAYAATQHVEALGLASAETGELVNRVGGYLCVRAQYPAARAAFERALAIDEAALGGEVADFARDLNDLGWVLKTQGEFPSARVHYERALAIREKVHGPEHSDVAQSLNNLGMVLHDQGDLPGAWAHLERALAIREKVHGPEHPDVAESLNNLGGVRRGQGDLPGARAYLERALVIREKVHGPEHPDVAQSLNNLGMVLHDQGDLPGAWAHLERALVIREKVHGPEHPDVGGSCRNLGFVYLNLKLWRPAEVCFERTLEIAKKFPEAGTIAHGVPKLLKVVRRRTKNVR